VKWTRSETLALAQHDCSFCFGLGMRAGKNYKWTPCNCVLRSIFRACLHRFHDCIGNGGGVSQCAYVAQERRSHVWSMKGQEYVADFSLVARRVLNDNEYRLFKFHCLYGAPWHVCAPLLHFNRGEFFHEVYRIQQKLGRRFRELQPYALYPLDEYFGGTVRAKVIADPLLAVEPQAVLKRNGRPRFPLAMAA
jgi:hypothetical protein